jgi:7-cyano-7-deazaguanine synthase
MTKAVAIVSGGMDSVTLAYVLHAQGRDLTLLSFDYGQRHAKELEFASQTATMLGAEWHRIDLRSVTSLLKGSSLTDRDVEVPDGHYAAETMRATVVPNRNAMMLDIASAVALGQGAGIVATGVHAGDHFIYPDCRPAFLTAYSAMVNIANEGFTPEGGLLVYAPFSNKTKADIVTIGTGLDVPYSFTWSCYKGGEIHCGRCGTCYERREAFTLAGVDDPTEYADTPTYAEP